MRKRGFFIAGLIAGFIFLTQDSGICAPMAEQWGVIMNISGRQRMISQKMAKEALLIYLKIGQANQAEALKKSIVLFENSLKGLKFGDSETVIPPTKSEEILGQLDVVNTSWATLKPLLNKISG